MGQLDDAIREHLDLKRRMGADPEEVAAQERDALGPVRREPEPELELEEDLADEELAEHREEPAPRTSGEPRDQM